jgi:hypothetical protein
MDQAACLTVRNILCFYAFMRTTVELPPELMRQAKARAAAQGESLKSLLTRAVASELGKSHASGSAGTHVRLPLFGKTGKPVRISNEDLERALTDEDVHVARRGNRARKK